MIIMCLHTAGKHTIFSPFFNHYLKLLLQLLSIEINFQVMSTLDPWKPGIAWQTEQVAQTEYFNDWALL